jgi:predicted RNase H-like HicB family nuclease
MVRARMTRTVQCIFKLPVKITKRRKWFLASCTILDVHSQGETEGKARNNLREALSLFFISCFERGTLGAALKECGFKPTYPLPIHKKQSLVTKKDYINVPIPFLVKQTNQTECHA